MMTQSDTPNTLDSTFKDSATDREAWLDELHWNADGLVPAIAQDSASGRVLMMAWMNAQALQCTLDEGRAVYWSRSRQSLWRKGEQSGHTQIVKALRIDCDGDTLLLEVEQLGGIACHTGRESCFYRRHDGDGWVITDEVLRDPKEVYGHDE